MTIASSAARSAAVVKVVVEGATPSSLTASAAASRSAVGILIDVLDVSIAPASRSSLIRSIAVIASTRLLYHIAVVRNR
jgi:hypothetical protein